MTNLRKQDPSVDQHAVTDSSWAATQTIPGSLQLPKQEDGDASQHWREQRPSVLPPHTEMGSFNGRFFLLMFPDCCRSAFAL